MKGPEMIQMKKKRAIRIREEEVDMEVEGQETIQEGIGVANEGEEAEVIGVEVGEEEVTPIIRGQMPLRKWPCDNQIISHSFFLIILNHIYTVCLCDRYFDLKR